MKQKVILFPHIKKTAGTTFKFILANNFAHTFCNTMAARPLVIDPGNLNEVKKLFPRLKALGGHNVMLEDDFLSDNFFRVTFVREPISRTISHFQHYCIDFDDTDYAMTQFHDWISDPENQNHQTKVIGMTDDYDTAVQAIDNVYDFIGLTEAFDVSLQILQQLCPLELKPDYKSKQKSQNRELVERVKNSATFMRLIKQHNEVDLKLYEYVREQYFEKYYLKDFQYDKNKRFNTIHSKYTANALVSKWYNKYIFRNYTRLNKQLHRKSRKL